MCLLLCVYIYIHHTHNLNTIKGVIATITMHAPTTIPVPCQCRNFKGMKNVKCLIFKKLFGVPSWTRLEPVC